MHETFFPSDVFTQYYITSKKVSTMSGKKTLQPSESPIWNSFEEYRGKVKRNKKGDRLYQWDYTHGDIEVYNRRGEHLGCIDGMNGEPTKPAVKGRTIDV